MESLIGRELGGYQIVEEIGRGGMATVYKAYEAAADRYVALKIMAQTYSHNPNFVAHFERAAVVQANLEHPYIAPVHAYGEQDGIHFLVMRCLSGGSLKEYIEQYGPLALGEACRLLMPIASALDYVHHCTLVHRNVKPSSILLDAEGNAYLGGFGVATLAEDEPNPSRTGVIGTPAYMAPEQCVPASRIAPSFDQYALGVVLYEMVTGRVPFEADTPMDLILKHRNEPPPPPSTFRPGLPEAVEQVILRALAKDPEARFETCGDLARAYERAVFKGLDSLGDRVTLRSAQKERKAGSSIIDRAIERLIRSPVGLALLFLIAYVLFMYGVAPNVVRQVYAYLFDFLLNLIR